MTSGISFCHGQDHHSNKHRHIVITCPDSGIKDMIEVLATQFENELAVETIQENRMVQIQDNSLELVFWLLPPDFKHKSIKRRILKGSDLIILFYPSNSD